MTDITKFFTEEDIKRITSSIIKAESSTSGEIRVRLEYNSGKDPLKSARKAFNKIGMRKTKLRNGVLFYLSIEDKVFVLLGDDEINSNVPDNFWESTKDLVLSHFKSGDFSLGLSNGIELVGQQLSTYFPHQKNDKNELSNSISFEGRK